MNQKNVIIIMIDGGRLDRAQNSNIFKKLKSKSVFFSNSITYGPHTIAAMHAVFSGSYGTRTGTNSYWSTYKFKKDKFKTLTEYLKAESFMTHADVINQLVVPKQGFDNYVVHDELNDDLVKRHKILLEKMNNKISNNNFFLYLHYSKIHTGIMNEVLKVYDNYSEDFFSNKEKNEFLSKIQLKENQKQYIKPDHNIIEANSDGVRTTTLDSYLNGYANRIIAFRPKLVNEDKKIILPAIKNLKKLKMIEILLTI